MILRIWQGIAAALLVAVFFLPEAASQTFEPSRESKLFDEGYDYYLEYRPEKAVETFKIFLRDFPGSSARDAAMFWMGKSLIQMNAWDEAEKVFSDLKKQFPDSPFLQDADRELKSKILEGRSRAAESKGKRYEAKAESESGEASGVKSALEKKVAEAEREAEGKEKGRAKAVEDAEKLKKLLGEEKKKSDEMTKRIAQLQDREKELSSQVGKLEGQQKKIKEEGSRLDGLKEERDRLGSEVEGLRKKLAEATRGESVIETKASEAEKRAKAKEEELKKAEAEREKLKAELLEQRSRLREAERNRSLAEDEKRNLSAHIKGLGREKSEAEREREELKKRTVKGDAVVLQIRGRNFTRQEIADSAMTAASVRNRIGIHEVPWATGNMYEDFVNEHLLVDEARRLKVVPDVRRMKELTDKHRLNNRESDALEKYLLIEALFRRKAGDGRGEAVESLHVKYTRADELEKAVFAAGLEAEAKKGRSFEEIFRQHPSVVRFEVSEGRTLQGWTREQAKLLRDGEMSGVLLTKDEYVILKSVKGRVPHRPGGEKDERGGTAMKGWVNELRESVAREGGIRRFEFERN